MVKGNGRNIRYEEILNRTTAHHSKIPTGVYYVRECLNVYKYHVLNLLNTKKCVLVMEFDTADDYRIVYWKENMDNKNMRLHLHTENEKDYAYLDFHRYIEHIEQFKI